MKCDTLLGSSADALEDAFPSLFEKKEQQDWWITKQRMESYAKAKK